MKKYIQPNTATALLALSRSLQTNKKRLMVYFYHKVVFGLTQGGSPTFFNYKFGLNVVKAVNYSTK